MCCIITESPCRLSLPPSQSAQRPRGHTHVYGFNCLIICRVGRISGFPHHVLFDSTQQSLRSLGSANTIAAYMLQFNKVPSTVGGAPVASKGKRRDITMWAAGAGGAAAGLAVLITVPVVLARKARRRNTSRRATAAATLVGDAVTAPVAAAASEEPAGGLATIQAAPMTPLVKDAAPIAPLAVAPQAVAEPDSPSTPPGDQEARRAAETPATGAAAAEGVSAPRSSGSFDASSDDHPHKSSGDAHVVLPSAMVAEAPAGAQVKLAAANSHLYKDDSANLSDAPAGKAAAAAVAGQPPMYPAAAYDNATPGMERPGSMDVASGDDDDCASQVSMVTDVATGLKKPRRIRPVKNTRKMVDNMRRSFDRGAELLRRASFQSSRSSIDVGGLRNGVVQ